MKNLKIYKASAGSGKTYNLTNEYIHLLLHGRDAYRHILAVTFTNKATEEMKRRIILELYEQGKRNPEIRDSLIRILHDYSGFNISTIDRFFQQAMRAFARELGKNSSYGVELDSMVVLSEAIDDMLYSLDQENNNDLLQWLLSFYMSNIERGDAWSRKDQIFKLSGELFKEQFRKEKKELFEKISDKALLRGIKDALIDIKREVEADMQSIGERGVSLMQDFNLDPTETSGGSRSPFLIFGEWSSGSMRLPTETLIGRYDNCDKWYSKAIAKSDPSRVESIISLYNGGMNSLIGEVIEFEKNSRIRYNTACSVLANFHILGILSDIDLFIKKYLRENNVLMLSDTTELLNRIIDGSDTPFVYEKIGGRIDHFMLDEFQDTSVMQWENMRPLLQDSIASGKENLIVGDVKQSIYRWRGSDWSLLEETIYNDFHKEAIETLSLSDNWRSLRGIIEFNNGFFTYASKAIDSMLSPDRCDISDLYREVCQRVPAQRDGLEDGLVTVRFIEGYDLLSDFEREALKLLSDRVNDILSRGFGFDDITVLVRKNDEGSVVADHLIKEGFKVVSDESLLISSSMSVRKIVSILLYCQDPSNSINRLAMELHSVTVEDLNNLIALSEYSIYELCEQIIAANLDPLERSESVFVTAFLDMVLEFSNRESSSLSHFLEWWSRKGCKKSISVPESQNAIRIMTIHKAKGLGLNIVVLPFFREPFDKPDRGVLWCKTDGIEEPFSKLPLLPLKLVKGLDSTLFEEQYNEELIRNYIDVLNVSYVAFTRAKYELHLIVSKPKESKGDGSSNCNFGTLSEILYRYVDNGSEYIFGTPLVKSDKGVPDRDAMEIRLSEFSSVEIGDRLSLALHSSDYFDENSRRSYGVIMHKILSRVVEESDIENSVRAAISDGELKESEYVQICDLLSRYLHAVRERHWFCGAFEALNETEIIDRDGEIFRPDRVLIDRVKNSAIVIDFKFGLIKDIKYERQVLHYMSLISETGFSKIYGYLWYLELGEVVEVSV